MEKINDFTDPACRTRDGVDRIRWVQGNASAVWARRGGKGVSLIAARYGPATANSSSLAGWLEMDLVGATGGHPSSVSAGDMLPVNFGMDKTCVYPTSNRKATEADVGRSFNIVVASNTQYVNMNATSLGVLTITEVIDDGDHVAVKIADGKRFGAI